MGSSPKQKPYAWKSTEKNTQKNTTNIIPIRKNLDKDKVIAKQLIEKIATLLEKKEYAKKAAKIIEHWLKK